MSCKMEGNKHRRILGYIEEATQEIVSHRDECSSFSDIDLYNEAMDKLSEARSLILQIYESYD